MNRERVTRRLVGPQHKRGDVIVLAAIALASCTVQAITVGTLDVGTVAGEGWTAEGVTLRVDLTQTPRATAHVRRVRLSAPQAQVLNNLRIECGELALSEVFGCKRARIVGNFGELGPQELRGEISFERSTRALTLQLNDLRVAGSRLQVRGEWRSAWSLRLAFDSMPLTELQTLAQRWKVVELPVTLDGRASGFVHLRGQRSSIGNIEWELNARQLTANNREGTLATDNLSLETRGTLRRAAKGWRFDAQLSSQQGQAFFEPIFIDTKVHPLAVQTRGILQDKTLDLDSVVLRQPTALLATGRGSIRFGERVVIEQAQLQIEQAKLPGAYALYVQPFFPGTLFGDLTTLGEMRGRIELSGNSPRSVQMTIANVGLDNTQRRFALRGLDGAVEWHSEASSRQSTLSWQGGRLLGLNIGPAAFAFTARAKDFALSRPVEVPLLDGSVQIDTLRVERAGQSDMELQVDATLRPISMQQLSTAFGWPAFGGRFGGQVSDLQLRNGVVTLGTTLHADVFDGQVRIADLKLEQVFSQWPRMSAAIAIDNVDLEQVTSAFSFGRITGRLSGTVNDLRLFNWQPVAFDADLHTPSGDRSRHRISQRAVDNIGRLGGGSGVGAALSSGFLRFFEDFNYDRLGISCKLANDVCIMGGIEPAKDGYYLVKGSGIPRIDVIGNARRVDWPRMVAQLQAATRTPEVQVE